MTNWKDYKKKLLKNPEFKKEYDALQPEYELAKSIIAYRIVNGLTQKQLAAKVKTKQSSISRLEGASGKPSLAFIEKIAKALDVKLVIRLETK
jgi:ribosome-binding protein aMBF1 (putative translation factor)